ncbi:hypothetical protein [Mycolicibacterium sp. A43C]
MDLATLASLLTALGVGGGVGQYIGASTARREVRSAFLNAVAAIEDTRFAKAPNGEDFPKFVDAVRELETAALIARIPEQAVHHYVVLARAARYYSGATVDYDPIDNDFYGDIDFVFDAIVRDTARLLTTLAWSPWRTRPKLRRRLSKIRQRVLKRIDEKRGLEEDVALAQRYLGALPGPLGQIPRITRPWDEVRDDEDVQPPPRHF